MTLSGLPTVTYNLKSSLVDLKNGVTLSLSGATQDASGLHCPNVDDKATVNAPALLQLARPVSIAWVFTTTEDPTGRTFIGCNYGAVDYPFYSFCVKILDGGVSLYTNDGTDTVSAAGIASIGTVTNAVCIATFVQNGANVDFKFYIDNTLAGSASVACTTGPAFNGTIDRFGWGAFGGGDPNALVTHFAVYAFELTSGDRAAIQSNPDELLTVSSGGGSTPLVKQPRVFGIAQRLENDETEEYDRRFIAYFGNAAVSSLPDLNPRNRVIFFYDSRSIDEEREEADRRELARSDFISKNPYYTFTNPTPKRKYPYVNIVQATLRQMDEEAEELDRRNLGLFRGRTNLRAAIRVKTNPLVRILNVYSMVNRLDFEEQEEGDRRFLGRMLRHKDFYHTSTAPTPVPSKNNLFWWFRRHHR